jgi:hypothetical protein
VSTADPVLARRRERTALLALAPLLLVIAAYAFTRPWRSVSGVDERTYTEMILGVVREGAPVVRNGTPAQQARFPELRARWNLLRGGTLRGIYPPVFPYVAAPIYHFGGLRAVIRFNVALLCALALGCYALGRRFLNDPWWGVAAAYVTVLATPVWGLSVQVSSYALAITLITWAAWFALGALRAPPDRVRATAAIAGLVGALAASTHIFTAPMLLAMFAVLGLAASERGERFTESDGDRRYVLEWLPTRASLARLAWAVCGTSVAFVPMALYNHRRFGAWSPVSYGPCAWRSCDETGMTVQNLGSLLAFAAPPAVAAAAGALFVWLVRRVPVARAAALGVVVLLFAPESDVHRQGFLILAVACAFLLDASYMPIRAPYVRAPDGLGNYLGPWVLKSVIQGTPFLALAPLTPLRTPAERHAVALFAAPAFALITLFAMRANMPSESAIGFSVLHFRYAMPAVPLVVVLALAAVRDLPWRRAHLALIALSALAVSLLVLRGPDDGPFARRFYILRVTLALAGAAFVLVARERARPSHFGAHAAAFVTSLALASGFATTLAIDLRAVHTGRDVQDQRLFAVERHLPKRLALVGWAPELESVLGGVLPGRDLVYADLYEAVNWYNFRVLIEAWSREGRSIYALFPAHIDMRNPWPDVEWTVIDRPQGLVHLRLR